jgi:hypothetical protein
MAKYWPKVATFNHTSQGVGQLLEPVCFLHFKVLLKKIEILLFFFFASN